MTQYEIVDNPDDDHGSGLPVGNSTGALDYAEALSGRNCRPWLLTKLRSKGTCYVATNKDTLGRAEYGRGFIVRALTD